MLVSLCAMLSMAVVPAVLAHTFSMTSVAIKGTTPFDEYGSVLYSRGDKLFIGAPKAMNMLGKVLIFHRNGHDAEFKLESEYYGREVGEHFGGAIAMLENTLFVSSPYRTCYLNNKMVQRCGGVHVFNRDDGANLTNNIWATQTIESDIKDAFNLFGASITTSDSVLAVGAPGYNGYLGHVTLYRLDSGTNTWGKIVGLSPTHSVFYGKFGHSVALYGRLLAVGSPGDIIDNYAEAGSVHVYMADETETKWNLLTYMHPTTPIEGGYFGQSIALYKNTMAIGSIGGNGHHHNTGSVYLYEIAEEYTMDTEFERVAILQAHDGETGDQFGCSVGIYEGTIAVGACNENGKMIAATGEAWQLTDGQNCGDYSSDCNKFEGAVKNQGNNAGALYLYSFDLVKGTAVSQWTEIRKMLPSIGGEDYHFGSSLTVNGDTVLVGSPGAHSADGTYQQVGAVYEVMVDWMYYKNGIANIGAVIVGVLIVAVIIAVPAFLYVVYLIRGSEFYEELPDYVDVIYKWMQMCGSSGAKKYGGGSGTQSSSSVDGTVAMRSTHGLLEDGSVRSDDKLSSIELGTASSNKPAADWGISRPARKKPIQK